MLSHITDNSTISAKVSKVLKKNMKAKHHWSFEHDDAIKWKHFPRYWLFVRGIHRSSANSPHKGQWRGALFSLICAKTNGWANNRDACDLRRHRGHYDVIVMKPPVTSTSYAGRQFTYLNVLSWMRECFKFIFKFHWSMFLRVRLTIFSIGSDNALAPNRRQAWTNDG